MDYSNSGQILRLHISILPTVPIYSFGKNIHKQFDRVRIS
jgi:hypothetical protein